VSDEPVIFGTYNMSGRAVEVQAQIAEMMQDYVLSYVLAFINDPESG
jgi:hypothetical protein